MNSRKLAGASAAIGAVAVTALLLGSTAAAAAEPGAEQAYGLSASGVLNIDPIPYVETADGSLVKKELLGLGSVPGAEDAGLSAGILTVSAEDGSAESSVVKLNLLKLLKADLVRTFCTDGKGGLELVNAEILGRALKTPTISGEKIDVSPLLTVSLGEESRNADGSLTVTGIKLSVLPGRDRDAEEELSTEDRAALPALGDLLGTDLQGADKVGGLLDKLAGPLGAAVNRSGSLQTITIGSATCSDGDNDANTLVGGDNGDNGDDNGDNAGDDSGAGNDNGDGDDNGRDGAGHDPSVLSAGTAPKPQVLSASLPVTH